MPGPTNANINTNNGYFKNFGNKSLIFGTYLKTPDRSLAWSNSAEVGGYLNGTIPVGERTTIGGGLSLGYAKATLNSDIEPANTKKNTLVIGLGLDGKVAITDNIAVTASAGFTMQGYNQHMHAEYMTESCYVEETQGFGTWHVPGEYWDHYGSHIEFLSEMESYNDEIKAYNRMLEEKDLPKRATIGQTSLGIQVTNNKNTVTGGIKGIFTHYEGFGVEKESGNNMALEGYGRFDFGHGVQAGVAINTNGVVIAGASITGLFD